MTTDYDAICCCKHKRSDHIDVDNIECLIKGCLCNDFRVAMPWPNEIGHWWYEDAHGRGMVYVIAGFVDNQFLLEDDDYPVETREEYVKRCGEVLFSKCEPNPFGDDFEAMCSCGHTFGSHDSGGPCEALVDKTNGDKDFCPCDHFEAKDAE